MRLNDPPLAVFFVHLEHDAVAAIIGNINVKQRIGITGYHPEIKFAEAVEGFYQFGKMYIFGEIKVHSVQFVRGEEQSPCVNYIRKC